MTLLIATILTMTLLETLNVRGITYNDITYNFPYKLLYLKQQIKSIYVMSHLLML
jgi:hypothetical protein